MLVQPRQGSLPPPAIPPTGQRSSETILTLQVLRGIAALLVLYYHAVLRETAVGRSFQLHFYFAEIGAVGVDVFFVVSGFVMALLAPRFAGPRGAMQFTLRRLIRIVPIYWLITAVQLLRLYLIGRPPALRHVVTSFAFVPYYLDGKYFLPLLPPGWSLSFEMYFYLAIAVAILVCGRAAIFWLAGGLSLAVAVGLVLHPTGGLCIFVVSPAILEFVLGCVLGMVFTSGRRRLGAFPATAMLVLGAVGLTIPAAIGCTNRLVAYELFNGRWGLQRALIVGIPSTLLVAGVVFQEHRLRNRIPRVLTLIGDASYSIYLTHLFTLLMFDGIWRVLGLRSMDALVLVAMPASVAVGVAHYQLLEKKLTLWLNRRAAMLFQRPKGEGSIVAHAPAGTATANAAQSTS